MTAPTASLRHRLRAALGRPVPASSIAAFRIAFGVLMVVATVRFLAHGWIAEHTQAPTVFFHHWGFSWVRPLPALAMVALYVGMGLLAALVALGLQTRLAAASFGLAFLYAHFIDKTHYLNHYYLVVLLAGLLAALPVGRVCSLDARRRSGDAASTLPAWVLAALRAQVGLVYVFGGIAKLKSDWLLHAQPMKIWLGANSDLPLIGALLERPATAYVASWAGALFDLSVVPLLLWRRSRPWAFAALVAFHLVTARLFSLGLFPYLMMALAPIFFAPDWPRRLALRMGLRTRADGATRDSSAIALAGAAAPPRPLAALLLVHFALQLLLPLRHLLYPGTVLWTEEGARFAWHVMIAEKNGEARFRVREPSSGRSWSVDLGDAGGSPAGALTPPQRRLAAVQPDMLLELAHGIARELRARGVRDPEVRADAFASLNGRPAQRLVDPTVDLARERDGLGPKRWILPLAAVDPP